MPAYLALPGTSLLPTGLLQFLAVNPVFFKPLKRDTVQLSVRSDHFSVRERPWRWLGHERAETHVGNMRGERVEAVEDVGCIYPLVNHCPIAALTADNIQIMVAPRSSLSRLRNVRRSSLTRTSRSTVTWEATSQKSHGVNVSVEPPRPIATHPIRP